VLRVPLLAMCCERRCRAEKHCLPENVDRSTIRKQCLSNRPFPGKLAHPDVPEKLATHLRIFSSCFSPRIDENSKGSR